MLGHAQIAQKLAMTGAMLNGCLNAISDCIYANLWWRQAVLSAELTRCIPPVRSTADDQRFAKALFAETSVSKRWQHHFNTSSVIIVSAGFALFDVLSILVLCSTILISSMVAHSIYW